MMDKDRCLRCAERGCPGVAGWSACAAIIDGESAADDFGALSLRIALEQRELTMLRLARRQRSASKLKLRDVLRGGEPSKFQALRALDRDIERLELAVAALQAELERA